MTIDLTIKTGNILPVAEDLREILSKALVNCSQRLQFFSSPSFFANYLDAIWTHRHTLEWYARNFVKSIVIKWIVVVGMVKCKVKCNYAISKSYLFDCQHLECSILESSMSVCMKFELKWTFICYFISLIEWYAIRLTFSI